MKIFSCHVVRSIPPSVSCTYTQSFFTDASSRHPHIHCSLLDWSDASSVTDRPLCEAFLREVNADIVVGTDVVCRDIVNVLVANLLAVQVYDPDIIPVLVDTLSLTMGIKPGVVAYLALTARNENTLMRFVDRACECRYFPLLYFVNI